MSTPEWILPETGEKREKKRSQRKIRWEFARELRSAKSGKEQLLPKDAIMMEITRKDILEAGSAKNR